MKIYVLTGWFGDQEWIESVYETLAGAEERCAELWLKRESEHAPNYCQGVCKFGVDEYELLP